MLGAVDAGDLVVIALGGHLGEGRIGLCVDVLGVKTVRRLELPG